MSVKVDVNILQRICVCISFRVGANIIKDEGEGVDIAGGRGRRKVERRKRGGGRVYIVAVVQAWIAGP